MHYCAWFVNELENSHIFTITKDMLDSDSKEWTCKINHLSFCRKLYALRWYDLIPIARVMLCQEEYLGLVVFVLDQVIDAVWFFFNFVPDAAAAERVSLSLLQALNVYLFDVFVAKKFGYFLLVLLGLWRGFITRPKSLLKTLDCLDDTHLAWENFLDWFERPLVFYVK